MAQCLQCSLADGSCGCADINADTGLVPDWDKELPYDEHGICMVSDDPCPGDNCEDFQPQWGNCSRCGEGIHECKCEDSDAESCGCDECEGIDEEDEDDE